VKHCLLFTFLTLLQWHQALSQEKLTLSLSRVIQLAKNQSVAVQQAEMKQKTRYFAYQTHLSQYKPQLVLDATLPAYNQSYYEVIQPDGSILFQPVNYNNSLLGLTLQQSITSTGTVVYLRSNLQRFDDFIFHKKLYNSTMFSVGIEQPLFQSNKLKWEQKIEPLRYVESQREFVEELELISLTASELYFDVLLSQENLKIAESNLQNAQDILKVVRLKHEYGKVSKSEVLQLQLETLKSEKALAKAKRDFEISALSLKAYIGLDYQHNELELTVPTPSFTGELSEKALLEQAYENRSDVVAFKRKLLEAERKITEAKEKSGLSGFLSVNMGYSNRGESMSEVLSSRRGYQSVAFTFTVPILNGGKTAYQLKTAEANLAMEEYVVKQDRLNLSRKSGLRSPYSKCCPIKSPTRSKPIALPPKNTI
jgi:outer membrane protein